MIASVLKQDPNPERFKRTLIFVVVVVVVGPTTTKLKQKNMHNMQIFGKIHFVKPQNNT